MALNSEELLVNDDIEGIFAITDSDILTEPKDLETKFAVAFSKMQEIYSQTCFSFQNCRKTYNAKGELSRHESTEHRE